ncbi:hypothetical protein THRCLA_06413 [Thraustotheca clavata]|uniref:Uncharacterized protein n=1 Tax=Thraustotheca clavata TaxID=74557 RepID=A0A1V9ZP13_9STRA|nr:hypothetical protein THRCLA_06413 [Thraustotheca clavata]
MPNCDLQRVLLLVGLQILSVGVAILGAVFFQAGDIQTNRSSDNNKFYILSGIPSVFLKSKKGTDAIPNDPFACLIAGLIPIRSFNKAWLFDLNRWIVVRLCCDTAKSFGNYMPLHSNIFCIKQTTGKTLTTSEKHQVQVATIRQPLTWWKRIMFALPAIASIIYMIISMESSSYYLKVSSLSLSNDLVWANFTMQTTHLFIAMWLNLQFPLMEIDANSPEQLVLDAPEVNLLHEQLDSSTMVLPGNRGIHVQNYQLPSVKAGIIGLRNTPASSIPWIMTPYCFVDFNQTWLLANSRKRQIRCKNYTLNGAVYMESVVRNIVWSDWMQCCGDAFTTGISTELLKTNSGSKWLNQTITAASTWLELNNEVNYWNSFGITGFKLQWQNYKTIGLINTYSVKNAYESSYSFTLEALNGSYRFASQTSFKMYWSLANDFAQLMHNGSGIAGKSLISTSSNYAFLNQSLQSTMILNATLIAPLNIGFDAVENALGPFGSIDSHFISVPAPVQTVVRSVLTTLHTALSSNRTYTDMYKNISISLDVWPVPMPWIEANFYTYGGSPLCDSIFDSAAVGVAEGLLSLFSFDLGCDKTSFYSHLHLNRETLVVASTLAQLTPSSNFTQICNHDPLDFTVCLEFLDETTAFTSLWIDYTTLSPVIKQAQLAIEQLNIELIQYATSVVATPLTIQSLPLLNPNDTTFDLYAWAMIYEWVINHRDVVHFVGDEGSFMLISERTAPITQGIYLSELSSTLTTYARSSNIFVTSVMMCVAFVVTVYIGVAHCVIERKNIFKLNRVGAFSWVGRPLVLVRSITAMCLLSTAQLDVVSIDGLFMLQSSSEVWYNIILAAGEVTWLVEVVNDVAMVLTREYTAYYATANSLLVWLITALLSFFIPAKYGAERNYSCYVAQVDYQIVCHSATIIIGHWNRMVLLILITVGCNVICYLFTRLWMKHNWESLPDQIYRWFTGTQAAKPIPNVPVRSLLLSGGATYLFSHSKWVDGNVYFLDRASAVINGILTVRRNNPSLCHQNTH